ncbi:MAG: asparagine synthase-related protein, partial [Christensenellaceae bacterium]|nr:asparagine synthase-related protein [Christensenellaceae bacterium]
YVGFFFTCQPQSLLGAVDAPSGVLGGQGLCAHTATDGGAMACASGYIRNEHALHERLREAGVRVDAAGGLSALVLAAYRLWGERYPEHLEGPVASAVIDRDMDVLVLSRDRMGEQRVFYLAQGASVAFADHPSALLAAPFARRAVDAQGLKELFALGPARTPGLTPIVNLKALEPGTALVAGGAGQRLHRYFRLEAREHPDSLPDTIEQVRLLVEDALGEVLWARPASMLSGGLDSTVLSALLSRTGQGPIRTWSVEYEEDEKHFIQNDYQHERDRPFVEQAVKLLGAEHRTVRLGQQALMNALHEAMTARGMPGMADVDASLMLFAREIAGRDRFVLSGECGDEVFGGYPWFHRSELIARDAFAWSGSIALRESVLRKGLRDKLKLNEYAAARYHESAARQPRLTKDSAEEARLRLQHGLCFEWFMPVLQERASAMCGASGVGVLTPYCDDRLVQYTYNVPWAVKNLGGQEKGLLREAMRDLLPEGLLKRRKSPYPKTHHPLYAELVCARMQEVLGDKASPILKVLDADAVRALMAGGLRASETPWYGQLMAGPQMIAYLLQIDDWLRTYKLEVEI